MQAEEPRPGPLPRTAAPSTRAKTAEEIAAASKDPKLMEYVRRRDFDATPEPAPGDLPEAAAGNSFVIQKHRATALHYDVRLERDGALPSWAVPKGLPLAKGDKRLAVRTEDHPLEYGSFEGTIPEGHYGAGEVRIFDDGWYEPIEWTDAKVSFKLHGRRYPGLEFHFVKTRQNWLAFLASAQDAPLIPAPPRYQPMLAEGGWDPFDDPGWWFEPKMDGIRCLAELGTGETTLRTRTGREATAQYPELHMIHELVDQVNAVIDGEIVAFDEDGRNSFETLQQRMNLTGEREIKRIAKQIPVALVVFDLLWLDGNETTGSEARGTPRTPRADRRDRPSTPGGDPRRGRGDRPRRDGGLARPRGRDGQAARLEVSARAAHPRLAQDQAPQHPGLRDRRVDAGAGRAQRIVRRAAGGRARRRRLALDRPGRERLHGPHPRVTAGAAGSPATADAPHRRPRPRRGEGRDLRRTRARLRGGVPADHEEHAQDARAVVQGPAPRQDP